MHIPISFRYASSKRRLPKFQRFGIGRFTIRQASRATQNTFDLRVGGAPNDRLRAFRTSFDRHFFDALIR
jgi:hypothetical protein